MLRSFFIIMGLFIAVWAITLGLSKASFINNSHSQKNQSSIQGLQTEDAPELKTILESKDQNERLEAGRKLVERVDVETALEILENSPLPHTGEGHLVVHQIGFYAYQKYGTDSILKCKDYFLYGCYHGAIIEAATSQGFEAIAKMTDKCKSYSARYFQCVHAAGHSIMAIWDYDLPSALKTCDNLFEKETQFTDTLTSCHNGAFMENLFGVHDWGTRDTPKRDWLKADDLFFPCNAFGEKYQKGCWLNQAARIYQMKNGNLSETTKICESLENKDYKTWCLDNVARQIHPLTNGDTNKVFEICQTMGNNNMEECIIVNANSYYSVGDREASIRLCNQIWPEGKNKCFNQIFDQLAADIIERDEKIYLCQLTEPAYAQNCFQKTTI